MREKGNSIRVVAMETILGEFLVDSQAFLFPMIHFFQMEEGRATIFGGWEESFVTATRPKQMYAAIHLQSFNSPHALLRLAADAVSPVR